MFRKTLAGDLNVVLQERLANLLAPQYRLVRFSHFTVSVDVGTLQNCILNNLASWLVPLVQFRLFNVQT